jgi:UPF0755 protein
LDADSEETKVVMVNQGDTFESVSQRLVEHKVLKHAFAPESLAQFRSPEDQRKLKNLTVGEYKVSPSMTPSEILDVFLSGDVLTYEYSIPSGATLKDIAQIIGKTGLATEEKIANLLYANRRESQGLIFNLGLAIKNLEGYIYPTSYKFSRPISPEEIVTRMYQEGNKKISDEYRKRAAELTFTFHDIRTLASIIEKETSVAAERARISSVLHNRLRIGMPLQSDPTVIYSIPNFSGELTKEH